MKFHLKISNKNVYILKNTNSGMLAVFNTNRLYKIQNAVLIYLISMVVF